VLGEFWRGERSLRQLRVLVEHLPAGGALQRARSGHGWVENEYLLTELLDAIRENTWAAFAVAPRGKGQSPPKKPKRVQRPGEKDTSRLGDRGDRSPAEVIAWLDSVSATKNKPEGGA
jgi:hypothetical protein